MNALYLDSSQQQSLNDTVTEINGVIGIYGTLMELTTTDSRFCWTSWSCCDAIPTADSSISSMLIYNVTTSTNYTGNLVSLIGGRPPRPIAR